MSTDNNHPSPQAEQDNQGGQQESTARHVETLIARQSISGPLPSASEMAKYDQISPDLVDRIVKMAEKEANHRHEMEQNLLKHEAGDTKRGQFFALLIGLAGFFTACFAILHQSPWIGAILGGGTLAVLVTAFIKGRKS